MLRRSFLAGLLAPKRPWNALFFAVDDLRPQLGCYGGRFARTPYIGSIAARGTVFRRAYCQQALCGPSRASLLTGLRPDTIGVYDLATPFRRTVPDAVTLPQLFKNSGYHTENIGKIFHGAEVMLDHASWSVPERLHMVTKRDQYVLEANKNGKDEWAKTASVEIADAPDDAYIDGRIANDAVETLGRIKDRPFFLAVGFNKPHLPFAAPKRYWDMFDRKELPLAPNPARPRGVPEMAFTAYSEYRSYGDVPDTGPIPEAKQREAIHGYYAATAYTDANVGKVLAALRRHRLDSNTLVILWGDHGWRLGELDDWGKTTNFEICTRAPLILSVPGQRNPGASTDALVEFVDIYPTLAELCGLRAPGRLEGLSFARLGNEPRRPWKRAVFSQYPRAAGKDKLMGYSMRTSRYRYTEWQRPDRTAAAAELYGHNTDPMETTNLAGLPESTRLVTQLASAPRAGWRAALPCLLALVLCGRALAQRDPANLLAPGDLLASPLTLELIPSRTSPIYRAAKGEWQFNLHSYLTYYQGKFWAVWSSGRIDEDSGSQVVRYATSTDGHTWAPSQVLAGDPDGPDKPALWITRGIYVDSGKLHALAAYGEGPRQTPQGRESWRNLRLVRFEWTGKTWANRGTYLENCMNNYPPRKLGDRLFMTCRDSLTRMYTALSDASGRNWQVTPLPGEPPHDHMSEPSWYVDDDGVAHLLFRDAKRSKYLYHSLSRDQGRTWSAPVRTNYPDATSKNIGGRLSDGRYFLINNPNQRSRNVLGITFSEDGWQFSHPRALRNNPPAQRFPGRAKAPNSFQYPHVLEKDGSLWVIYSTNKEDIEVSEFKIADFPRDPGRLLGDTSLDTLPPARGRTSMVFKGAAGDSGFNLHSYLAFHDGQFFAAWSSSRKDEEDPDQHIRYSTSKDGRRWAPARVLAADPDGPQGPRRWITRGLFVTGGKLNALGALVSSAGYGKRGREVVWKDLQLMRYQWTGKQWEPMGVYADNCMNNFPPATLGGKLFMACRDRNMDLLTATASTPPQWTYTPMTAPAPFDRLDEPSWYAGPDGVAHMIIRDNRRSGRLIRSVSRDNGATWSVPVQTNYPDATSKNFTGRLSNGWYYLINNPNPKSRDPLTVSFSRDGWTFGRAVAVRTGGPPRRFHQGSPSLQYPHAIEHGGALWVIYSTNKEDIEVTELPLAGLNLK
jgi:iduronate 2-sulfatase